MSTNQSYPNGTTNGWSWTAYPSDGGKVKIIARRGSAVCHIDRVAPDEVDGYDIDAFWRQQTRSPLAKPKPCKVGV